MNQILETEKQEFLFYKPTSVKAGESISPVTRKGLRSQGYEYPADQYKRLKKFSHQLKINPTVAEIMLKNQLVMAGIDFEFQYIIPPYIADFYFRRQKVIVNIAPE